MPSRAERVPGVHFGIDFGTTNSLVATCQEGALGALRDPANSLPHPSVVWYRPEMTPVVGREALGHVHQLSGVAGNHFIRSIKTRLGTEDDEIVFGRPLSPADVAADIFRFLVEDAATHGLELRESVVSIPVSFTGRQRRALRTAADRAGVYIKSFVHEPFAALVGYCFPSLDHDRYGGLEDQNVLVFDWGGGTLDITVAKVQAGQTTQLGTADLPNRAGDYFDQCVHDDVRDRFLNRHGLHVDDTVSVDGARDRFLAECRRAKVALSLADEEHVNVAQCYRAGERFLDVGEPVSRSHFENLIDRDVRAALNRVEEALEQASLSAQQVNRVLLVGGTSEIPLIRREMMARFGPSKIEQVDEPDAIIARGAAVVSALNLQPVLAKAIGVRLSDGTVYEVFPAGQVATPEACRARLDMFCTDNRDGRARLILVESHKLDDWRTLGVVPIPVSRERPHIESPERVTVDLRLDEDMVLNVEARGATQARGAVREFHDLRFGLLVEGA